MKAYKGFNKDMTCRGFQFKEGETYHEDNAELCQSGFHACEDPLDCLQYYPPATSIYRCSTSGYSGRSTSGDSGCSTSRGASQSGRNGVSVVRGSGCKVRGGLGALLVIAEENYKDYEIKEWKAVMVDGEKIKADVWYKLQDGELVEVEADE